MKDITFILKWRQIRKKGSIYFIDFLHTGVSGYGVNGRNSLIPKAA